MSNPASLWICAKTYRAKIYLFNFGFSTERIAAIGGRISVGVFAVAGGAFLIVKKKKTRKQVYITKDPKKT